MYPYHLNSLKPLIFVMIPSNFDDKMIFHISMDL